MEIIPFSIIVGLLNLDDRNITSMGLSRPIIVAPILGYFLDCFYYGVFIGAIIELIIVNLAPIGTYIPPKPVIITGVVMYLSYFFNVTNSKYLIPLILLFGFFWGHMSKRFTRLEWKFNDYLVEKFAEDIEKEKFNFFYYNFIVIFFNFIAYSLIVYIGILIGLIFIKYSIWLFFYNYVIISVFQYIYLYLPLFALLFLLNNFDVPYRFLFFIGGILFTFIMSFFVTNFFLLYFYSIILTIAILILFRYYIFRNIYE